MSRAADAGAPSTVETEIATRVETMYVEVLMGARPPLPRLCRVMVLALRISPPPPLRVISAGSA
jgi:hypothetical protein